MLEFCQNQSLVPDISVYNCCRYSIVPEQKARVTYDNILRLSDDPDVNDVIKFLREREVVHFQRFGETLYNNMKWIALFTAAVNKSCGGNSTIFSM